MVFVRHTNPLNGEQSLGILEHSMGSDYICFYHVETKESRVVKRTECTIYGVVMQASAKKE